MKVQKQVTIWVVILILVTGSVCAHQKETDAPYRKFFASSTICVLADLNTRDSNAPDFVQLNFDYCLTPGDVVSVEAKTWKYAWLLGIPYQKSFETPEEKYRGYVRSYSIAFACQHFLGKEAATLHAMNALQRFNTDDKKQQTVYQLSMTYRVGYHAAFFKKRLFIEPSIALTPWPVNTNVLQPFANSRNKRHNYFLFEPGTHSGIKF